MDNIIFEKIYEDDSYGFIELKITANSEFITAYQICYVDEATLIEASNKIANYLNNCNEKCYIEFGDKKGNCTPAFSMEIFPSNKCGHIKIEVDIEIVDNDTRCHRCCFFVNSELGLLERFGKSIKGLFFGDIGTEVSLFTEN